jgi:hypothetical protein
VLRRNAFCCISTSITKNVMLCKRLLPCWSLQRNLIVALEIIDGHNGPITTFFFSKQERVELWPTNPATPITKTTIGSAFLLWRRPRYSKIGERPNRLGWQQASKRFVRQS